MLSNEFFGNVSKCLVKIINLLGDVLESQRELELRLAQSRMESAELRWQLAKKTAEADEAEAEAKRWKILATTDTMTGIPNRFGARLYVAELLSRQGPFEATVVLADGGGVKKFNDTYGHNVGDMLIENYAFLTEASVRGGTAEDRLLRELHPKAFLANSRIPDLASRWGGDEYVSILPGPAEGTQSALDRITTLLKRFLGPGLHLDLGHCHARIECMEDFGIALKQADAAMYAAKEARKAAEAVEAADLPLPDPQG